jgi:hypothetical protein
LARLIRVAVFVFLWLFPVAMRAQTYRTPEAVCRAGFQKTDWHDYGYPYYIECAPDSSVAPRCDDSLWKHVYNSRRLIVKQKCVAVTGMIVDATHGKRKDGVRKEADGTHTAG